MVFVRIICQLLQEKEKHEQLTSGEEHKEVVEAQEQVERLRNELKIRQKINQLQTNKVCVIKATEKQCKYMKFFILQMQEVSALIAALEQRQDDCSV